MMWGCQDVEGDLDKQKKNAFYGELFAGRVDRSNIEDILERDFMLRERMRRTQKWLTYYYDTLTERVPDRYRLPTAPRAGEIGIRHRGRILSPDLITYQNRLNALYGFGALGMLEHRIAKVGHASLVNSESFSALEGCAVEPAKSCVTLAVTLERLL